VKIFGWIGIFSKKHLSKVVLAALLVGN